MMKKLLFLPLLVVWYTASPTPIKKITIITNDDQRFSYVDENEIEALQYSRTINNFLQDFSDQEEIEIPLNQINGQCWLRIEKYIKRLFLAQKQDQNKAEELEKIIHQLSTTNSADSLSEITNECNYLDHHQLLEAALTACITKPEFLQRALEHCQFNNYLEEKLQKKLRAHLASRFAKDSKKPIKPKKELPGHLYAITSMCYSPDGNFLATCSTDTIIIIWDIHTGKTVHIFREPSTVNAVCYHPDGTRIASCSNIIRVRNTRTSKLMCNLSCGHTDTVTSACYNPDGTLLASSSNDNTICIWNNKDLVRKLTGHSEPVNSISFDPNGEFLASGSSDKTIMIWDISTGKCIHIIGEYGDFVKSISYSPDGNFIASASNKGVQIWNVHTEKIAHILKHTDWVWKLQYSSNGDFIASGELDGATRIWNAHTGTLVHTFNRHSVTGYSLCFSPDDHFIATGTSENKIIIWDFMDSIQKFIEQCSLKQRLFLALAFQKKIRNHRLNLDQPDLKTLFKQFDTNHQELIQHILPISFSK